MKLAPNTVLQQRYVILRLLGQGGFGAVYETRDKRLGHRVALKQLVLGGQVVQQAFEREGRILARLKHGALPKVSDYFVHSTGYFLVMDDRACIEGNDFEMLLDQQSSGPPFAVELVLEWADQVLAALEYLHSQQPPVIHRDIKPGNIKLSPEGQVYLLDFGISKGGKTHTNQAMSGASVQAFSLHYASMEQIEGKGTDARSDLYSLGVTLHHLLTNQKPPQTVSRANDKLMNKPDPLPPVNEVNPLVPVEVAQVLSSALNFDPNLRPQSARAMRDMLKQAIQQDSIIKRPTSRTLPLPLGVGLGVLLLFVGIVGGRILFGGANNIPVPTIPTMEIAVVPPTTVAAQPTDTIIPLTATPLAPPPTATTSPTSIPEVTSTVKPTFSPTPTTVRTSTPDSDQSTYIVREGDTTLSIAEKSGTTVDELRALNNLTSNFIYVGQELKVPSQVVQTSDTSAETPASAETAAESASTTTTDGNGNIIHVVQANEWLYDIARKYEGVSSQDILDANNMTNPNILVPGMELIIPVK